MSKDSKWLNMKNKTQIVGFRMPVDLLEKIDEIAIDREWTRTQIFIKIVEEYFAKYSSDGKM